MEEENVGKKIESTITVVSSDYIAQAILTIRGLKVMLDEDLAALYNVETKNLNKAVKRNIERFPGDFTFQITPEELENLRFQFGTSKLQTLLCLAET